MEKETATNPQFQAGLMFVFVILGLIGKKILDKVIDRFFKKTIDTQYVPIEICQQHRQQITLNVENKINEQREATQALFVKINQNIEKQNENIEKLNGLVIIGIMQNEKIPDEQKKEAVISLTTHRSQK